VSLFGEGGIQIRRQRAFGRSVSTATKIIDSARSAAAGTELLQAAIWLRDCRIMDCPTKTPLSSREAGAQIALRRTPRSGHPMPSHLHASCRLALWSQRERTFAYPFVPKSPVCPPHLEVLSRLHHDLPSHCP
jgi:hypothetical protein